MYTNINFLKERNRLQEMMVIRDKKIAMVTSIVLGVFLCVMIGILSFQLFTSAQFNNVAQQSANQQRQLSSLLNSQTIYLANYKKFSTIKQLLSKRGNKWDAITYVYSILPPGNTIDSVNLQADTVDALDFSVKSNNIFAYDAFSKVIQSDQVKQSGFSLDLGTLSRSKDGTYHVDITLTQGGTSPTPAKKAGT